MPSLVLIGAGGHCLSCIEAIESTGQWTIVGIVDRALAPGELVHGYKVLGADEDLARLASLEGHALVCVGQVGSADLRIRLYSRAVEAGFSMPAIVAASARVSARSHVAEGTIILHGALVNAGAEIGNNCIVNSGAIIEHDAKIGDHCHVSTGAIVNGGCMVGPGCLVGSGAVLKHGVSVAPGCLIGAGAVVTRDIARPGVYVGCPAKERI